MEKLKQCVLALALLATAACGSRIKPEQIDANANAATEIDRLSSDLIEAKSQQVDVLSPENFRDSVRYLNQAKADLAKGKSQKDVLEDIGYASAYLHEAENVAKKSREQLEPVLEARKQAVDARAHELVANDFKTADNDLKLLGSKAEKGSLKSDASEFASLQQRYLNLQLQAMKLAYLGSAYSQLEKARDNGARSVVPETYEQTRLKIANAEKVIASDRNNQARIEPSVAEANEAAEKLTAVLGFAKSAGGRDAEKLAVQMYEEKKKEAALRKQAAAGAETVESVTARMQALAEQNKKLQAKASLQEKIAELRKSFDRNEAEVLQDGNKIIFRLKSVNFPVNRADLPAEALATLGKVRTAVTELSPQRVVVQGHADSVGSKKVNKEISERRAEAVKEYLVSANAVPPEKVEAQGVGYQKPIGPNKTKEGRTLNRRVDIIVEPEAAGAQM